MSLKATAAALDADLPHVTGYAGDPVAKLVLILISDMVDEAGLAELDLAAIQDRSGLPAWELRACLQRLDAAGYLQPVEAVGTNRWVRIVEPANGH